jgi:hypothetical protein
LAKLARHVARLARSLDFEVRPDARFIKDAIERGLRGRLAHEDSEAKRAVVIGDSLWLAGVLGLKNTRLLHLPYPEFTIENLALLSDEHDFVIADRLLHRCESLTDAAGETVRVLRPGGWFVHTASALDFALMTPVSPGRLSAGRLRSLFPHAQLGFAETAGTWRASWIVGRKAENTPALTPTMVTRTARRRHYSFNPRHARFAVATMARNEAPYLLEWIAYYRLLGFGQITIYDNNSNDGSGRILEALSAAGIVNAVRWKDRDRKQAKAYEHAARRLRRFVEWCLFIDMDEFLVLDPSLGLDDLVPKDPGFGAVVIGWRVFGSAGKRNREVGLTIERFTKAQRHDSGVVKSFVRVRDLHRMTVHTPKGLTIADVDGRPARIVNSNAILDATSGRIRLNHYMVRSWEEFECKRARGRGSEPGQSFHSSKFERAGPGEVELGEILRWAPAVREEVARLRKIVER